MPFQSESQRRFLWMHHPAIARKWAHEHPNQGKLPEKKKDKPVAQQPPKMKK